MVKTEKIAFSLLPIHSVSRQSNSEKWRLRRDSTFPLATLFPHFLYLTFILSHILNLGFLNKREKPFSSSIHFPLLLIFFYSLYFLFSKSDFVLFFLFHFQFTTDFLYFFSFVHSLFHVFLSDLINLDLSRTTKELIDEYIRLVTHFLGSFSHFFSLTQINKHIKHTFFNLYDDVFASSILTGKH